MTVFVDSSALTFVYGCHECPWWRGIALSGEQAEEAAIAHEETIHDTHLIRRARDRRHARAEAKSANRPEMDASVSDDHSHGIAGQAWATHYAL